MAPTGGPNHRISSSRYPVIVSAVLAIALAIVLDKVFDALVGGEKTSHAVGHLTYALPALLLVFSLVKFCPPPKPTSPGRRSRNLLVAGLSTLGVGGVAESIGATDRGNYDSGFDAVTALHDLGLLLTFVGMFTIFFGAVLLLLSLRQSKAPRALVFLLCAALVLLFVIR